MASNPIGLVTARAIVQEIAPVIVQEIAPAIVQAIVLPALAIAVQVRVMSEGQAQAHAMSAAVGEIRTSAVMSEVAAVMSAAVGPAPARWIVAAAVVTMVVAVATMDQVAQHFRVAPVQVRATAAAVARPVWRARVGAAGERAVVVGDAAVEVGDDG
jgi:hypothetical protein